MVQENTIVPDCKITSFIHKNTPPVVPYLASFVSTKTLTVGAPYLINSALTKYSSELQTCHESYKE